MTPATKSALPLCSLTPEQARTLPLPAALELLGLHRSCSGALSHAAHLVGPCVGGERLAGEILPAGSTDAEVAAFLHADGYVECDESCCVEVRS